MKCILYKYVANSVKELRETLLYIQKSNIKTTLNTEENTVIFAVLENIIWNITSVFGTVHLLSICTLNLNLKSHSSTF